jgi:tetratricopeptide (TPR) repeat protein
MLRLLLLLALAVVPVFALDDARRDEITQLFNQREWARARTLLEQTTAAEPANAEAWHFLGQCLLALGDLDPAVAALTKATELAPQNSNYYLVLGNAYGASAQKAGIFSKLGLAKSCKAAYEKAVALDPTNINARWSLMEYCRQAPGIVGGGMDQAYAQAAEIKKLDARRGRAAYASLYAADKKVAEAFALYDEVLRDQPDDSDALYQIGRLAARSGEQLDRGLTCLRSFMAHPDHTADVRAQTYIAMILEKKADLAGAKAAYAAAVAIDPAFPPALEGQRKLSAK